MHTLQHSEPIQYDKKAQTTTVDTSKLLSKDKITLLQSKLGTTYYYIRIMDMTILVANNDISIN